MYLKLLPLISKLIVLLLEILMFFLLKNAANF